MEMSRIPLLLLLLLLLTTITTALHPVPVWENLSRQDKMGQIMYVFHRLVEKTCINSDLQDCHHILTLHGMANLINMKDGRLNSLDPKQAGSTTLIWKELMSTPWKLPEPYLLPVYSSNQDEITNEITTTGFHQSPQISPPLYPNYPPIPNALNTPLRAVSDPHPYAVTVPPPPGFVSKMNTEKEESSAKEERHSSINERKSEIDALIQVPSGNQEDNGDNDGDNSYGLSQWSDGDGDMDGVVAVMSDSVDSVDGLILGNKQYKGDNFASWTDVDEMVNGQQLGDSRLGLENAGMYASVPGGLESWQDPGLWFPGDRFGGFADPGMFMESQGFPEFTFGPWDASGQFENGQELPGDRFGGFEDAGMFMESQGVPERRFGPWNIFGQFENEQELPGDGFGGFEDAGMYMDTEGPLEHVHGSWKEGEEDLNSHQSTPENRLPSLEQSLNNPHNTYDRFASWTDAAELETQRQPDVFRNWLSLGGIKSSGQDTPHDILEDTDENPRDQKPIDRFASWTDVGEIRNTYGTPEDQFILGNWGGNEENTQSQDTQDRFASWNEMDDFVNPGRDQVIEDRLGGLGYAVDILEAQKPADQFARWKDVAEIQNSQNTHTSHLLNLPNTDQTEENILQVVQKPGDQFARWNEGTEIQNSQNTHTSHLLNLPITDQTEENHGRNEEDILQVVQKPADQFARWNEGTEIQNSQNTPDYHHPTYPHTSLPAQTKPRYSSDPYTLWANSRIEDQEMPSGLLPTADFEPLMVESKVVESRLLPPPPPPPHQPQPTAVFTTFNDDRRRRRRTIKRGIYLPLHLLQ